MLIASLTAAPVWIGRDRSAAARGLLAQNPEVDVLISGQAHVALADYAPDFLNTRRLCQVRVHKPDGNPCHSCVRDVRLCNSERVIHLPVSDQ